jgi:hypothetical protein
MRARLGIDALIGDAQSFYGTPVNQVFLDDLGRVFRLHAAIPDRVRINYHRRSVFALIETARFVDPHCGAKTGSLRQLR